MILLVHFCPAVLRGPCQSLSPESHLFLWLIALNVTVMTACGVCNSAPGEKSTRSMRCIDLPVSQRCRSCCWETKVGLKRWKSSLLNAWKYKHVYIRQIGILGYDWCWMLRPVLFLNTNSNYTNVSICKCVNHCRILVFVPLWFDTKRNPLKQHQFSYQTMAKLSLKQIIEVNADNNIIVS